MIEYKTGNIFTEDVDAFVNSVNCVGFMGRGIALQFKHAFPENFKAYAAACKREEVQPGRMFVHETGQMTGPRYIVNFPTKRHWRGKSRIEDIESGLDALARDIEERGIRSIAIPPLGSGLGGLEWADVRDRIESALGGLDGVRVIAFEPDPALDDKRAVYSTNPPEMTNARAVLVTLIDRYLAGLLDPDVSLLEIHKLMYFMQAAGEPLRLKFKEARYGPYAENLRHVLHPMEGHLISGYADGGDTPGKPIELVAGAVEDARAFLEDNPETRERFQRVSDLVEGFESAFGLELLATVHWVAAERPAATEQAIVERIYAWNPRKRQFSPDQIGLAIQTLKDKGWIPAPSLARPA